MNFIVDMKKALYHSSITRARCGEWIHVSYCSPRPKKTQMDLHEDGCPKCQESYRTGVLPDYAEMERLENIERQKWMQEYVEKNKE